MTTAENTLLDATIQDLDRVMNGCEPGDDVPEFTAACMVELRAILRKLLAAPAVVA